MFRRQGYAVTLVLMLSVSTFNFSHSAVKRTKTKRTKKSTDTSDARKSTAPILTPVFSDTGSSLIAQALISWKPYI